MENGGLPSRINVYTCYLSYVWTFGDLYLCLEVCYDSLRSII